jgi:hypothetical protein
MKRLNWVLIGVVILYLATIPFAGCGAKCEYRDFSSLSELQDWLLANDVSEKPDTTYAEDWYGRALEVQEDALKDSYIVSADYDYNSETESYIVTCVTTINGHIFYWNPETDEVFEEYGLGTVK